MLIQTDNSDAFYLLIAASDGTNLKWAEAGISKHK